MAVQISKAMLAEASRSNARMPDSERWSRLVKASGRLAKRVTRKGITASELRDERPKRAQEFGSELPRCRKHGAKGSTKTLPGRTNFGRGQVNTSIVLRNSMIAAGLIRPVVVKRVDGAAMAEHLAAKGQDVLAGEASTKDSISFDTLKRMLTGVHD